MHAYVGCFTTAHRGACGKGISLYGIDDATGVWTLLEIFDTLPNPGFLALDSRQRFLYCAHGDGSEVSAYAIEASHRLRLINRQPTHGDNSPHISVAPDDSHVILCNGPGLATFPINPDGSLMVASDAIVPPGKPGPYRNEQNRAHPHQALYAPGSSFVVVADKGLDKVHVYRLVGGKFVAGEPPFVESRYGSAPRHIAFHPAQPWAYLVTELGSTVVAYRWEPARGALTPFQVLPATPDTHTGNNKGAEICVAPSGAFVYLSNRGQNAIAVFGVDQSSGRLNAIDWTPTEGRRPRFFTLSPDGERLYVANQDSDNIVEFEVNNETGKLAPTGQTIATGAPSCIVFTYAPPAATQ